MILLGCVLMLSHGNAAQVTLPPVDNDSTDVLSSDESNVMVRSSNSHDGKFILATEVKTVID